MAPPTCAAGVKSNFALLQLDRDRAEGEKKKYYFIAFEIRSRGCWRICIYVMGDRGRDGDWALWLGDGKWLVCHFCSLSLWQWRNVSRTSIISSSNWSTRSLAICISAVYIRAFERASESIDGVKRAPAHRPLRHRINQIAPSPLKSRFLILQSALGRRLTLTLKRLNNSYICPTAIIYMTIDW